MSDEEEKYNSKKSLLIKEEVNTKNEEYEEKKEKDKKPKPPDYDYKNIFHRFAEYESKFQPPDRYFKYVWLFLYITYIISLITTRSSVGCTVVLSIGLGLNILWIPAFLFFKSPLISLVILTAMLILAVDSVFRLFKARKFVQGVFLCFYLAWLCFAFYLNAVITQNYYKFNYPILPNQK